MAVLSRPYDIETFMWATRRASLRMEKLGMKLRGGALRPKFAAELGLQPRDSIDTFINKITEIIDKRNAEKPADI